MKYRKVLENLHAYKAGKTMEEIQKEYGLKEIIRLNANENPYGFSKKAMERIKEVENIQLYPDDYCTQLRRKLAKKYDLKEENFLFGDASNAIIPMITRVLVDKDDEVITSVPGFSLYESATLMQEGKLVGVPIKNFGIDVEGILKKINEKTKVIYITNPHNPTGTILTKQEQEELIKRVPKDIMVVLDEAYYEFVTNKEYPDSIALLKDFDNVCILRTFSKAYGLAGLRIGYIMANAKLIEQLEKIRNPYNVSQIAQQAAIGALEDDFMEKCVQKNKEVLTYVGQQLDLLKIEYIPSNANFIFIDTKKDSKQMYEELLKKGIAVRAGYKEMNTYIRVSMGTKEQMEKFIQTIKEIY